MNKNFDAVKCKYSCFRNGHIECTNKERLEPYRSLSDANRYILDCPGAGQGCEWEEPEGVQTNNSVNHPNHYCQGGIECIKAIEAAMPPEGFQDYCKGNVLKYIWRWRDKNGVEDLKKASVYLNWIIESAEKELQNE